MVEPLPTTISSIVIVDVERGSVSCVGVLQSVSEGTQRSGRLPHSFLLPLDKLFSVDKTGLVGRSEPEAAEGGVHHVE